MLTDLRVRGLGVIDDLSLPLGHGMTALTGETGAGKTLVVEALQLVLGARGDSSLVRAGAGAAEVEATFDAEPPQGEIGTRELILARSVPADGRSKAYVDGRSVPQSLLAETAADLVDICGQHDHQSLLRAAAPARALDTFAGIDGGPLHAARARREELRRRLDALGGDEQQRAREVDMLRFQLAEIEGASLGDPDEDEGLWAEEQRLADASALREAGSQALELVDGPGSEALAEANRLLAGRETLRPWDERLRAVLTDLSDLASDLRRGVDAWQDDPERLEEVQRRRKLLADLRRKYGETLGEVIAFGESARVRLDDLLSADETANALAAELEACERDVAGHESAIRQARRDAAPDLARAVTERLATLAMPGSTFEVSVADDGTGDPVRFMLSANPGEPAQPLQRVASGGELARTMLALRLVTMGGAPVLVFDEVDAGVGGEAALALAAALGDVARHHQVLVVTHLPQVAAFADHHVVVEKRTDGGRTTAGARALDDDGRVVELSRMLSGHPESDTARAHAAELLSLARTARSGAKRTGSATRVRAVD